MCVHGMVRVGDEKHILFQVQHLMELRKVESTVIQRVTE